MKIHHSIHHRYESPYGTMVLIEGKDVDGIYFLCKRSNKATPNVCRQVGYLRDRKRKSVIFMIRKSVAEDRHLPPYTYADKREDPPLDPFNPPPAPKS